MDLWPAATAQKGQFAVENGYTVEGFPLHHDHGLVHGDGSERGSNMTNGTAPTFEVGRTGGATVVGTGQDARRVEMAEQQQQHGPLSGPHHHGGVAVRHFDDYGRPQQSL